MEVFGAATVVYETVEIEVCGWELLWKGFVKWVGNVEVEWT